MSGKLFLKVVIVIIVGIFVHDWCIKHKHVSPRINIFSAPTKSPFDNNVGIDFSVEETEWYNDKTIKFNSALQNKYTYERLKVISNDFKLIRIYSFLVAGWEQTGQITPEAYSVVRLAKEDKDVELVIGTSCNKDWYSNASNVQMFVDTLQSKFGYSISQVKTILIGNEINANSYTPNDVNVIMANFKKALLKNNLSIPVTVTFSNLPIQKGDDYSDNLVSSVVSNWGKSWNDNKPFVFIDPYPDAIGVNNAAGIFAWQYEVTEYYKSKHPSLQIFIGETGAEGSNSDSSTVAVIDSVFSQLTLQYDSVSKTVPTFLFEAVNETLKIGSPDQKFMGIYLDYSDPKKTDVKLKSGIMLPNWLK